MSDLFECRRSAFGFQGFPGFIKAFFLTFFLAYSPFVLADFSGVKGIFLKEHSGDLVQIGTIRFTRAGEGYDYSITFDDRPFEDQFLSMRPFKCLMGRVQVVCYVEYPYKNPKYIDQESLTSLEYDLLFLHKSPTEYGINLWNGNYYTLSIEGDSIVGKLSEVDMNILSAPPEDGSERPITHDDLFEADLENQRFPELIIK